MSIICVHGSHDADVCLELIVYMCIIVCGFEAFVNGKHIAGEVKEKEQAHKECWEAISQGHGAYLMDEETPICLCVCVCQCLC